MKIYQYPLIRENFIFSVVSVFLLLQGCQPKSENSSVTADNDNVLVGHWQAEWQTKIDENYHSMKGELHFNENGKVAVKAYGYQGCYFMSDTSKNEMAWKVIGDTLHLMVPEDNFSFAYQIKNISLQDIHLTLLEDINLHLKRAN